MKQLHIKRKNHKKAFSMITAIFVLIMMATLSSLIMNVSGKTVKATTQQYQKEQALLLARSYTELAILYVSSHARNVNCIEHINATYGPSIQNGGYGIRVDIRYVGKADALVNCTAPSVLALIPNAAHTGFDDTVSLVMDTYVTYRDFDELTANRVTTFHKRTLQKL